MLCLVRNGVLSVLAGSLAALAILSPSATAAPVFFGPTPYLSAADSPFDLSGLGTTMYLEDFEDGELNTPGILFGDGTVMEPSPTIMLTDSVDADDGTIDGFGWQGHSVTSSGSVCSGEFCSTSVTYIFDTVALGGLPTAAGIVWTDGLNSDEVKFSLLDRDLNKIASIAVGSLADFDHRGGTAEDRFFGVIEPDGIFGIQLSASPVGGRLEADHLQYGFFVPEPSAALMSAIGICGFAIQRRPRKKEHVRCAIIVEKSAQSNI